MIYYLHLDSEKTTLPNVGWRLICQLFFALLFVLFFFPTGHAQAIGISPPAFELGTVGIDSINTVKVTIVRSVDSEPTGDINISVTPRKSGSIYFFGAKSITIPDGKNSINYLFNVIPYAGMEASADLFVDFKINKPSSGSGVSVITGATMVGTFTVDGVYVPVPKVRITEDTSWVKQGKVAMKGVEVGTAFAIDLVKRPGGSSSGAPLTLVEHSVQVNDINEEGGYAVFIVQSEPQIAEIEVGESESFDLDGDGSDDLSITLNSVEGGVADMIFEQLGEEWVSVEEYVEQEIAIAVAAAAAANATPSVSAGTIQGNVSESEQEGAESVYGEDDSSDDTSDETETLMEMEDQEGSSDSSDDRVLQESPPAEGLSETTQAVPPQSSSLDDGQVSVESQDSILPVGVDSSSDTQVELLPALSTAIGIEDDTIPPLNLYSQSLLETDGWYPSPWVTVAWANDGGINPSEAYVYVMNRQPQVEYADLEFVTLVPQLEFQLDDGVYYFHAARLRESGHSEISTFQFSVDTSAPDQFVVTIESNPSLFGSLHYKLLFSAYDKYSGMDYYQIYRNGEYVGQTTKNFFELTDVPPGTYQYEVRAFDRVGNLRVSEETLTITAEPIHTNNIRWILIIILVLVLFASGVFFFE